MNKLYIVTALTLASITFVSAESEVKNKVQAKPPTTRPVSASESKPQVTTLDGAVGAQIKALNKEMEDKIKAVREEYMAKIQAVLQANKVSPPNSGEQNKLERPVMGTSTNEKIMAEVKRKIELEGANRRSPTTPPNVPVMRADNVKEQGERQEGDKQQEVGQDIGKRVQSLFRGIFGRNS